METAKLSGVFFGGETKFLGRMDVFYGGFSYLCKSKKCKTNGISKKL